MPEVLPAMQQLVEAQDPGLPKKEEAAGSDSERRVRARLSEHSSADTASPSDTPAPQVRSEPLCTHRLSGMLHCRFVAMLGWLWPHVAARDQLQTQISGAAVMSGQQSHP